MTDTEHSLHQRPGGTGTLGGHRVARIGYGAMQLERVHDENTAQQVLRRAVELGVDHIDTASFYGDATVNRLIRSALAPYPEGLTLVSKVGARHVSGGEIPLEAAQHPAQLRAAVETDLRTLGVERVDVVNLRRMELGPGIVAEGADVAALDDQMAEMVALRDEGKIGAIGLSNVSEEDLRASLSAEIVCVQNAYNVISRGDESLLETCRKHGIAWVPYFPLGAAFDWFPSVPDNPVVREVAAQAGATPGQIGLAWLLAHSENTLLIPGTGSIGHLEENLGAGGVRLSAEAMAALDGVAAAKSPAASPRD